MKMIALALAAALLAAPASAAVLYDSGPSKNGFSPALTDSQSLGAMVTFDTATTINAIKTTVTTTTSGLFTIKVRNSTAGAPGAELCSGDVNASPAGETATHGFPGFTCALAAGSYWITFETTEGSAFAGSLFANAENPLSVSAFTNTSGWQVGGIKGLVFSVEGVGASPSNPWEGELPSGAPEPATWALMLMGFGGAGAMIRRRRVPA